MIHKMWIRHSTFELKDQVSSYSYVLQSIFPLLIQLGDGGSNRLKCWYSSLFVTYPNWNSFEICQVDIDYSYLCNMLSTQIRMIVLP